MKHEPEKTNAMTFRMTEENYKFLRKEAYELDVSKGSIINDLLFRYRQRREKKQKVEE